MTPTTAVVRVVAILAVVGAVALKPDNVALLGVVGGISAIAVGKVLQLRKAKADPKEE